MSKILNTICLTLWSVQLLIGVLYIVNDIPITPIMYVGPVLICIMHYAEKLLED